MYCNFWCETQQNINDVVKVWGIVTLNYVKMDLASKGCLISFTRSGLWIIKLLIFFSKRWFKNMML